MRKKSTLLSLALVSAWVLSGISMAGPGPGPGPGDAGDWHGPPGGDQMMMLHQLNLSDAQRASVKQILSSSFDQDKPAQQALEQQRNAFEAMAPGSAGYQAAAANLAAAEGQAAQKRVMQMADLRARVYAVLTPAQQSQVATLTAQAQARRLQWQQFEQQHPLPPPPGF